MGLLAMGSRALGFSSGFAVKVGNEEPGPQSMMACSPDEAKLVAWGIVTVTVSVKACQKLVEAAMD